MNKLYLILFQSIVYFRHAFVWFGTFTSNRNFVLQGDKHFFYYLLITIYIPGELDFVSFITAQFYVCKLSNTLWPDGRIRLIALYTNSLSSLCRHISRYWTSKILLKYRQVHSGECVSKSILSVIFHAIHGAVCIQLTRFSYDDCENMCALFHHHRQLGNMTHLPFIV